MAVTDGTTERTAPFAHAAQEPLARASHLPGYVYASPEIYAAEKEAIFMKDWLCVGRVEEVENPGDYITLRITDEPVVVARDETGALNAFANVCAHRGVEVASGSGNTKEFSCPYHGWLYDLSGRLIGAPYMKEAAGFDPANCRLKPLKLGTWAGWIFITFNQNPLPLEQHLDPFIREYGFLQMEDAYLVDKVSMDLECNWKFAVENSLDSYHAQTVHRDTFGAFMTPESFVFDLWDRGASTVFYGAAPHTPDGKPLFGVMSALAGRGDESFATSGFVAPNMHIFGRCENFRPGVHWPLSPTRTRLLYYNLIPREFLDRPGIDAARKTYREYYMRAIVEDEAMIESLQRGISTRAYQPGRMAKMEVAIHHAINYYVERMAGYL